MSKRSERREAERLTRKLAHQAQKALNAVTPEASHFSSPAIDVAAAKPAFKPTFRPANLKSITSEDRAPATFPANLASTHPSTTGHISTDQISATHISPAQLAANRANAQLSTGPITAEGQAISSRNALKTGLTGRSVLLPTDDPAQYQLRLDQALAQHRPVGEEEQTLVQSIVDTDWRLDRIVTLETGIHTKGMLEFADKFSDQPQPRRAVLIQTETYLKYEKSLKNLNIQEARLQRQRAKNVADLKRLREERFRRDIAMQAARKISSPAAQPQNGFDFSNQAAPLAEDGLNVLLNGLEGGVTPETAVNAGI